MTMDMVLMVECRIMDGEPIEARHVHAGQAILFGGNVWHVTDATFTDESTDVKVDMVHYKADGKADSQSITVDRAFEFKTLAITQLRRKFNE